MEVPATSNGVVADRKQAGVTFHTGNVLPLVPVLNHPDTCDLTSMLKIAVRRKSNGVKEETRLDGDHAGMKITVKLFLTESASPDDVVNACDEVLSTFCLDYLDTFLVSVPRPSAALASGGFRAVWETLERLESQGKIKSLGVCGFSIDALETLLGFARTAPRANVVYATVLTAEVRGLIRFCRQHNISVLNEPYREKEGLPGLDIAAGLAEYNSELADGLQSPWAVRYTAAVKCRTLLSRTGYLPPPPHTPHRTTLWLLNPSSRPVISFI